MLTASSYSVWYMTALRLQVSCLSNARAARGPFVCTTKFTQVASRSICIVYKMNVESDAPGMKFPTKAATDPIIEQSNHTTTILRNASFNSYAHRLCSYWRWNCSPCIANEQFPTCRLLDQCAMRLPQLLHCQDPIR